jgi:branched-chain amino acid transport system ATP-binding protein
MPAAAASDPIQAMLKEFEIAAARAGQAKPLPSYAPNAPRTPRTPSTAPPSPPDETPVTIEVYRAPRVEVYRRRPSGDFERE